MSRSEVLLSALLCCSAGLLSCCSDDGPATSQDVATAPNLDAVTGSSMAEAARERGFRVREEVIEREELPGGTIHRLTLDHGDRGTAFEDLYDLSQVEAHAAPRCA